MRSWLDEGELVSVAAMATGRHPDDVLAACDVAALAWVVSSLEQASTAVEAAAVAVLEVGRRRPFGHGSTPAAWLTAAHLLSISGLRLRIGPVGAAGVLAPEHALEVTDVVAILEEHSDRRPSRMGRILQPLFEVPRVDGPSVLPCPACGRSVVLRRRDVGSEPPWTPTAIAVRVARCAVDHRTHDRWAPQLVPA